MAEGWDISWQKENKEKPFKLSALSNKIEKTPSSEWAKNINSKVQTREQVEAEYKKNFPKGIRNIKPGQSVSVKGRSPTLEPVASIKPRKLTPLKRSEINWDELKKQVKENEKQELKEKLGKIPGVKNAFDNLAISGKKRGEVKGTLFSKDVLAEMTPADKLKLRAIRVQEREEERRRLEDKELILRGEAGEKIQGIRMRRAGFDDLARQRLKKDIERKSVLQQMKKEARLKRKIAMESAKPIPTVSYSPGLRMKSRPNVSRRVVAAQSRKVRKIQKQRRRNPNKQIKRKRSRGWHGQTRRHSVAAKKGRKSNFTKRRKRLLTKYRRKK